MLRYALGRLLGIVPTLLVIVTAAFFVMRLAPGGPFDEEQAIPPEIEANLQAAYGLDQPVLVQYGRYLQALAHGDLGPSFKYKDYRVSELIARCCSRSRWVCRWGCLRPCGMTRRWITPS